MKKTFILLFMGLLMFGFTSGAKAINLVYNGDFELGNVGFGSDYTYNAIGSFNTGSYTITQNPHTLTGDFADMLDHTSGSGVNLMVFDLSNSSYNPNASNIAFWKQAISSIIPNKDYEFSVWYANVDPYNPGTLNFTINGESIGIVNLGAMGVWNNYTINWNSQNNTVADIRLYNISGVAYGNDSAVDDISLTPKFQMPTSTTTPAPEPSSLILGLISLVGATGLKKRNKKIQ